MSRKTIFAALFILLIGGAAFSVPEQMNFQGILRDNSGNPLQGSYTVTFFIYADATGGVPLWTETRTVAIEDGLFNIILGEVTPIPTTTFDGTKKYLATQLQGDSEMVPRVALITVPYAFRAGTAEAVATVNVAGTNQVLTWTGTALAWANSMGGGSVVSIDTGSGLTGGPITVSGTVSVQALGITSTHIATGAVTATKLDSANTPTASQVLSWNGTQFQWVTVSGLGTIDAADVTYHNVTYPNVEAALDYLLYVNPSITSFTNTVNAVEIGTTVNSTTLNWTLNKNVTAETLNQGIGSITPSLRTYTHVDTYTTDRTYTLTVNDGTNNVSASSGVYFRYKRYYGTNASATLNDGQIISLTGELSTSRVQTRNGISPSNEYIYIVYPAAWGTATSLRSTGC